MPSLSAGIMLSTSFLCVLPDAFAVKAESLCLFATLLGGLLTFFLAEKLVRLRQSRRTQKTSPVTCCPGQVHTGPGHSARIDISGNGLHDLTDGVMISAAFLTNPRLGILTGLAIIANTLPHTVTDRAVLLTAGCSPTRAYCSSLGRSSMGMLGAAFGYLTLAEAQNVVPYVQTFASAGFIYTAVSHILPRLKFNTTPPETTAQLMLLGTGIGLSLLCR